MKKLMIFSLIIFLLAAFGCNKATESDASKMFDKKVKLETMKEKASYSLGYNMGQSLRPDSTEMDLNFIMQGLADGITSDEKAQMKLEEMQKTLRDYQIELKKKREEKLKVIGEKNKEEGPAFLKENAKKEGVKTTESGLQYTVMKEGTGELPKATDRVKVHYLGTLIDGTEFDSSYKRGQPAVFPVNRVIKGWTEALLLMKVGAKWKLFIPAELAYKEQSRGALIAPNSALLFEVELLGIEPPSQKLPSSFKSPKDGQKKPVKKQEKPAKK
jgi:FKBP-type peptidyl-prolyl cis-trans isomerase FklB